VAGEERSRIDAEVCAESDADLGGRLVAWLRGDPEGRRILRALQERPEVGRAALRRRLEQPEFLTPLGDVATGPGAAESPAGGWLASERTRGLPRMLPLAGTGLLLGGFAAFMLGILALGRADPGFPPVSVFGITLMVLAAVPFAAGTVAARRRPPPLPATAQSVITVALVGAAVAVAAVVAAWVD
jgi:hypothetical protein